MSERREDTSGGDAGHEPQRPRDERFAPVLRGDDAEGRTRPEHRDGGDRSGTGVPGTRCDHPDALPPDTAGVRQAERADETRPGRRGRR